MGLGLGNDLFQTTVYYISGLYVATDSIYISFNVITGKVTVHFHSLKYCWEDCESVKSNLNL